MIEGNVVIDGVIHGYSLAPDNQQNAVATALVGMIYDGLHVANSPKEWTLDRERYLAGGDPDLLASAVFGESQTDIAIYHGVPAFGFFKDGGSPLWVGKEMRERWPGRVALYGPISPLLPNALEEVDRLVEEDGVVGLKFYPVDLVDGVVRDFALDDPELCYPLLERAQQHGLRTIAIHKAIPLGPMPIRPFAPGDLDRAILDFPDLTFEVVHGGWAFLEETALQVARFANVTVNLESTSMFLLNAPRKFAEILGALLASGGAERVIWGTGCTAVHPQPFLEAFWNFQMPQDLIDGYGYPELTDELKAGILGGNIARILGLDVEDMRRAHASDEFASQTQLAPPWSARAAVGGAGRR